MGYSFPSMDLLNYYNPKNDFTNLEYVEAMREELASVLASFKVGCSISDFRMTPFAVLFDVVPDRGVSVKAFRNLRIDLEVHMASPVEIVGIGEKMYTIGIAIKNWERPTIGLRDTMETDEFRNDDGILPIAAGIDVLGKPFVFDLAATPHLLVAGTTGSGKSVFLSDIILSILYTRTPEDVRFMMVDPKRVELSAYDSIPHMLRPVIVEKEDALEAFAWLDAEMRNRYKLFKDYLVNNIDSYNKKVYSPEKKLPRIVVIVDEYMEMILEAPKDTEMYITSLSRMARAAGIHLVLATQRPSSDVITADIKANIPCRASFTVVDWRESRTILDRTGAERLLGNGDMLFSLADSAVPIHAQASYVSYEEVDRVIADVSGPNTSAWIGNN